MLKLLMIGMGGFIGALARYGLSVWVMSFGHTLPFGTLVVNLVGSALFGMGIGFVESQENINETLRAFLFIGILGAFTTFSTFSYEAFQLIRTGEMVTALFYVGLSVGLGTLFLWLGYLLVHRIFG